MLAVFDDRRDAALVATDTQDVEGLLGMARYDTDPKTGLVEVALVVRDEWQGRGVGTALFVRLIDLARAQGVRSLHRASAGEQRADAANCSAPVACRSWITSSPEYTSSRST